MVMVGGGSRGVRWPRSTIEEGRAPGGGGRGDRGWGGYQEKLFIFTFSMESAWGSPLLNCTFVPP